MKRVGHGDTRGPSIAKAVTESLFIFKTSHGAQATGSSFDYMFPQLQGDPASRLDPTPEIVQSLKLLAKMMSDLPEEIPGQGKKDDGDGVIPAAYTYFGQFLDHDITFDRDGTSLADLANPLLMPLSSLNGIQNIRSSTVDLDSVYAVPAEAIDGKFLKVGKVTALGATQRPGLPIKGKSIKNDLFRQGRDANKDLDRAAIIGDPRNDENTIVAQLHTAFLKAHNSLIDDGLEFESARRALILRYQTVVLNDFLRQICIKPVIDDVLKNGPTFWKPSVETLFMPVEFSVAAYRFGHSMIRKQYAFNENFRDEHISTFAELFSFTALSGQIGEIVKPNPTDKPGFDTLPENWVIEWERFLPLGDNPPQMARLIDPRLTDQLFFLRDTFGKVEGVDLPAGSQQQQLAPHLAMRNLLRGYLFGLPTGQAVARHMNLQPLEDDAFLNALPSAELQQLAKPFAKKTPLWFYILTEALSQTGGKTLGEVGSRIVAETLWNLVKHAKISILDGGDHSAFANFTLSDIIKLAAKQDNKPS